MTEPTFTREQVQEWATKRADDAGRLAAYALSLLDRAEAAERERDEHADALWCAGGAETPCMSKQPPCASHLNTALAARDRTIAELRTKIANMEDLWGFELLPNGGTRAKAIGKTLKYLANEAVTQHVAELEAKLAEQAARIAELDRVCAWDAEKIEALVIERNEAKAALADARQDAERLREALVEARRAFGGIMYYATNGAFIGF